MEDRGWGTTDGHELQRALGETLRLFAPRDLLEPIEELLCRYRPTLLQIALLRLDRHQ